jgi:uncharacterized protein YndB with AHSA1/START domain
MFHQALLFIPPIFLLMFTGPSLDALKRHAAAERINGEAPVQAKAEIVIEATREKVWQTLAHPAGWGRWHPAIRAVDPGVQLAEQTSFKWSNGGTVVTSHVVTRREGEALSWVGSARGAKAVHVWRLSELSPTSTLVQTEESMDGFLIQVFFGRAKLQQFLTTWLAHLKAECER